MISQYDGTMLTKPGPTMTILTPDDQFSQDLYFASPWMDGEIIAILAIIANDSTNLYLNDRDLIVSNIIIYILVCRCIIYGFVSTLSAQGPTLYVMPKVE